MKTLSVVIPAYNEEASIEKLLQQVLSVPTETQGFLKEVIVVDDGSSDGTAQKAESFFGVKIIRQKNLGKGAAVKMGVLHSTGDYVLVQDADLEYDPKDYLSLLSQIQSQPQGAVYGRRNCSQQSWGPIVARRILTFWTWLLYGRWISDMLTGYKVYPASFLRRIQVKTQGFETDHELTAKLIRLGVPIVETTVSYRPRSVAEGKKIRTRDGFVAMWVLFRFRFLEGPQK